MLFRQLFDQASGTYTYLLADSASRKALLIDPVFEQSARDLALVRELELELVAVLDTHVHADHVTGAWLARRATGAKIALSARAGAEGVDLALADGDRVEFGALHVVARATPGHTDSCTTFVLGDRSCAFTGDALLIRGAGRTDFQQGDAAALYRSITQVIFALPPDCRLYPGHDYAGRTVTTVAEERTHNPRVGGGASERDFVGFMDNLRLPHPRRLAEALPANLRLGRPETEPAPPCAWGPAYLTYAGVLEIDTSWVTENLGRVTILDVREDDERAREFGVIPGAIGIPLGALASRIDEVPRDNPIVTVCRSGRRSAQALSLLRAAGIERCANLAGGMIRWTDRRLVVDAQPGG